MTFTLTLLFADVVVVSDLKKNIDTPIHSPPNCQPIKTRALFGLQIYLRDTSQNGGPQAVEGEEKNQKERESFGRGGREGVFPSRSRKSRARFSPFPPLQRLPRRLKSRRIRGHF